MKIRIKDKSFDYVKALPKEKHLKPKKPNILFRTLIRTLSAPELISVGFRYNESGMERLENNEPCLFLMNHSSFIDLKIASAILYPRPFNIVCTSDGFIGKKWLMRNIGCIPTRKFVSDSRLARDMLYALRELKSSVLMYPEASYSFDGTATPLPESLGKCIKLLKVPVVMIRTHGAFLRDPLYNKLQLRKVNVSADVEYVLSPGEIAEKNYEEINEILERCFSFDNFKEQQEKRIRVDAPFRADGLNRVLYKCPHCLTEGKMSGEGILLKCSGCKKEYELTEFGFIRALKGETEFSHIPDWYSWERSCVREELQNGNYRMEIPVDICILKDMNCIYRVGEGTLTHSSAGFHLTGCDGKLDYTQKPTSSYSLYADYYWYEVGDVICIGDSDCLYYCFPKDGEDVAAKARLAAEEMYKIERTKKQY